MKGGEPDYRRSFNEGLVSVGFMDKPSNFEDLVEIT